MVSVVLRLLCVAMSWLMKIWAENCMCVCVHMLILVVKIPEHT